MPSSPRALLPQLYGPRSCYPRLDPLGLRRGQGSSAADAALRGGGCEGCSELAKLNASAALSGRMFFRWATTGSAPSDFVAECPSLQSLASLGA